MAALDTRYEPTGQEDHAQDDTDEQPDEGAGAQGALVEELAGERAGHRRRLPQRDDGRNDGWQQRVHGDDESRAELHESDNDRGCERAAEQWHATRTAEHSQGAAVHHDPHEEGRRGGRSHQRLEVCRHGCR